VQKIPSVVPLQFKSTSTSSAGVCRRYVFPQGVASRSNSWLEQDKLQYKLAVITKSYAFIDFRRTEQSTKYGEWKITVKAPSKKLNVAPVEEMQGKDPFKLFTVCSAYALLGEDAPRSAQLAMEPG